MNTTKQQHTPFDLAQFKGYTPGPWMYGGGYTRHIYGSNSRTVCTLRAFHDRFDLTAEKILPDANLIAAAPALLAECCKLRSEVAALRTALEQFLAHGLTSGKRGIHRDSLIAQQARAALGAKP